MPRQSLLLLMIAASGAIACSTDPSGPPPVDLGLGGGFTGTIADGARLVIASSDGRVLLDGLGLGDVPVDGPPLVGFAVRDMVTTYEMQFGSFKPTDAPASSWRGASSLVSNTTLGTDTIDVFGDGGTALAHLTLTTPAAGHLVVDVEPGDGPERRLSWGFVCNADDHFNGFGAQTWDVDHRGFSVPTFVQEEGVGKIQTDDYTGAWFLEGRRHSSQIPIPEYLSRRGYILTTETNHRAIFALCSESTDTARIELDIPAKIDIFDGPKPADAIARATATFGRPRMPPPVAFAPWNDAIFGSTNVRAVATALRAAQIPTSVIWTEDWRGGVWNGDDYTLKEEWDVDTTLYPDFPQLATDLHGLGYDFFIYYNPFIYKASAAWQDVEPKGFLVKEADGKTDYVFPGATSADTGLLDLDNKEAQAWAVGKMQTAIQMGADGWMNDFGEWLPTDGVTAAGPSLESHNLYPVRWQETARAAIDGVMDGKQRLFFSRSGWLGTPPLADVVWAGDQRTTMDVDDGLPTVLPIGIGLGIVGISTFAHDIGGYQSATNPPSTKEVFFRWTEVGAWTPVMRTHHGTEPKLEWSWSSDAETTAHYRRYATLHMALVPFFEGLAFNASNTGLPIWHGLALDSPEDATVWPITTELTVGGAVLVAPVMTPGATSRSLYLPAGRWFPWSGGASIAGGATIMANAPVTEIPVYARAGAVVPSFPAGVMTLVNGTAAVPDASSVGDDRILYAFLGASGAFTEAGGLAYSIDYVADPTGAITYRWAGKDLAACAATVVAPCVATTPDGATANVVGPGTLDILGAGVAASHVSATGGAATRKLTIVVRR